MNALNNSNLQGRVFLGEVVDNNDPEKMGRCKIKIHSLFDNLDIEHIPWAIPSSSKFFAGGNGGYADISIPRKGTAVRVIFAEGDIYAPEFGCIQHFNNEVQNEIKDSYLNSHVLMYDVDEKMKVFYTPSKGMEIHLKDSHITINPDSSITIEHKDSNSIIELVGTSCNITTQSEVNITANNKIEAVAKECIINGTEKTQIGPLGNMSAVGSEVLWAYLKSQALALDNKWPASPGVNVAAAEVAEIASTSKNNKVSVP